MNNEVFLQRISAAVREQQLAEQATKAAMQLIVEACAASMPRRPANYHRKPAYWWNEELAGLQQTATNTSASEEKKSTKRGGDGRGLQTSKKNPTDSDTAEQKWMLEETHRVDKPGPMGPAL